MIGFSNPQVSINNVPILIMPNSLKIKVGKGSTKVRAQSAGGNSTVPVVTQDKSTQIGEVKFDMAVIITNMELASTWKDNLDQNVITISQAGISTPIVYQNMAMVNDPDYEASADGKFSLEFMGQPAIAL